jgi:hypothetical protein
LQVLRNQSKFQSITLWSKHDVHHKRSTVANSFS